MTDPFLLRIPSVISDSQAESFLRSQCRSVFVPADVDVRHAVADDAAAIAACYRNAYRTAAERGYPSRMTDIEAETVADWLDADAVTFVATPAQDVDADGLGAVEITTDESTTDGTTTTDPIVGTIRMLEERPEPYLERLAVVDSWQGRGLGSHLVERVEGLARDRGYDCLQLTTFQDHPFLYDWYAGRGYEPIEHHERPQRPYDFVTMERQFGAD